MFKQSSMPPLVTQVQIVGLARQGVGKNGSPYFQLECYGVMPGFLYPQAFEAFSNVNMQPGFYDVTAKFKIEGRSLTYSFDFSSATLSQVSPSIKSA